METKTYLTTAEKLSQAAEALAREKEYWSSIENAAQALPQGSPEVREILEQCALQQEQLDRLLHVLAKE